MGDIIALENIDPWEFLESIFSILFAFLTIITVFEKVGNRLGIKFKWQIKREEEHSLLTKTVKLVDGLIKQQDEDRTQSIKHH